MGRRQKPKRPHFTGSRTNFKIVAKRTGTDQVSLGLVGTEAKRKHPTWQEEGNSLMETLKHDVCEHVVPTLLLTNDKWLEEEKKKLSNEIACTFYLTR